MLLVRNAINHTETKGNNKTLEGAMCMAQFFANFLTYWKILATKSPCSSRILDNSVTSSLIFI